MTGKHSKGDSKMISASDLAKEAKTGEMTNEQAQTFLDSVLKTIMGKVASGDEVRLMGFGTFSLKHTKERQLMNPGTRKMMTVPAKSLPKFKPGSAFKTATMENREEEAAPVVGKKPAKKAKA